MGQLIGVSLKRSHRCFKSSPLPRELLFIQRSTVRKIIYGIMAEVAPAPAAAAPAKAPKKKAAPRPKKTGPSVGELVVKAISASKEKKGVSLAALKKALAAGGYDVEKNNARVKIAIKSLVTKGTLVQTKGTGASGSFKLNKAKAEPKKKAVKKAAPKAKKPAAKKPAAAKKPKKAAAKKPAAAKKSPKKAKKPAVAKPKKAVKSPKKAKKPAAAKPTKSPKKTKAAKPKVAKPKAAKPKKAAPKKK
ncbi:histone H1-like [Alosa sapidissima]|uniref:histone H1-like n=2 Tax=Alosa TaxID=34772 RepID=UPI001C082297|nr:histone H1-like [Alosa sapidissima]XP_041961302.1 histone H1-like [Alosa sapidissima]